MKNSQLDTYRREIDNNKVGQYIDLIIKCFLNNKSSAFTCHSFFNTQSWFFIENYNIYVFQEKKVIRVIKLYMYNCTYK